MVDIYKLRRRTTMNWITNAASWVKGIAHISILLIALGVVWQVLFGNAVPFVGGDVVGNVMGVVAQLGSAGLVGLITLGILVWLFRHFDEYE